MSTQEIGDRGGALAAAYLERKGYTILERNYRFERAEVDLICFMPAPKYEAGGELRFCTNGNSCRSAGTSSPASPIPKIAATSPQTNSSSANASKI